MRTNTFTQQTREDVHTRKIIFRVLLSMLIILSLLYVYFIGSTTFNILARRTLENSRREIGNNVSQTELQYLALSNSINAQFGKDIGFVDAKGTIFAQREDNRVALR